MCKVSDKLSRDVRSQADWSSLNIIFHNEFPKELPENLQVRSSLLMLHRIMQLGDDCMLLMKHDRYKSVYMIQRSILEAYVELKLILKDEKHIEEMEKNHYDRLAKFYRDSDPDLFSKYKDQGKPANQIWMKFKEVGFEKNYNSFYRIACGETHPSLASLISDLKQDDGGNVIMCVTKEKDKQYLYFHCLGLLVSAMHDVSSLLSFSPEILDRILEIGKANNKKASSIDWKRKE